MAPIYDFHCNHCSKDFESLSKPHEPVHCPECKTYPCEKRITAHSLYRMKGDNSASTTPGSGKCELKKRDS